MNRSNALSQGLASRSIVRTFPVGAAVALRPLWRKDGMAVQLPPNFLRPGSSNTVCTTVCRGHRNRATHDRFEPRNAPIRRADVAEIASLVLLGCVQSPVVFGEGGKGDVLGTAKALPGCQCDVPQGNCSAGWSARPPRPNQGTIDRPALPKCLVPIQLLRSMYRQH